MINQASLALRGGFIAFEGGEGAGKTTQIQKTGDYLSSIGIDCLITREPGELYQPKNCAHFWCVVMLIGGARSQRH